MSMKHPSIKWFALLEFILVLLVLGLLISLLFSGLSQLKQMSTSIFFLEMANKRKEFPFYLPSSSGHKLSSLTSKTEKIQG